MFPKSNMFVPKVNLYFTLFPFGKPSYSDNKSCYLIHISVVVLQENGWDWWSEGNEKRNSPAEIFH
jgi:hypothetical protein